MKERVDVEAEIGLAVECAAHGRHHDSLSVCFTALRALGAELDAAVRDNETLRATIREAGPVAARLIAAERARDELEGLVERALEEMHAALRELCIGDANRAVAIRHLEEALRALTPQPE